MIEMVHVIVLDDPRASFAPGAWVGWVESVPEFVKGPAGLFELPTATKSLRFMASIHLGVTRVCLIEGADVAGYGQAVDNRLPAGISQAKTDDSRNLGISPSTHIGHGGAPVRACMRQENDVRLK